MVLISASAADAGAGDGSGQGSGGRSGDVISAEVVYRTGGGAGGDHARCGWKMIDGDIGIPGHGTASWPRVERGVTYHLWRRSCPDGDSYVEVAETTPAQLLPSLLEQLRRAVLPKPIPDFEMLDPEFGWAYVRTPLDFRAGGGSWRTVSVTATLGPVWATVTARPVSLRLDPGDPARPGGVRCGGRDPIAPYLAAKPGACSYTYLDASSTSPLDGYHFRTTMSIDWSISWTSSTGAGGTLAPYSTSTSSLLAVAEVKGLVTCTGPRPEQGSC
jgi:hypothetical protein